MHELGGMEAEDFGAAEMADHSAAVRAGEGVAGIEEEGETTSAGEFGQLVDRARPSPYVHA